MVNCLPGVKTVDFTRHLDSAFMFSAGEESVVVVHVGANDIGKGRREVLRANFGC